MTLDKTPFYHSMSLVSTTSFQDNMGHSRLLFAALLVFWVTSVALPAAEHEFEPRIWTNSSGKSIEASLLRVDGDIVHLRMKSNGAKVKVKQDTLSVADMVFLEGLGKRATDLVDRCAQSSKDTTWYWDWWIDSRANWIKQLPELSFEELQVIAAAGKLAKLGIFCVSYTPDSFKVDQARNQTGYVFCKEGFVIEKKARSEYVFSPQTTVLGVRPRVKDKYYPERGKDVAVKGVAQRVAFPSGRAVEYREIGVQTCIVLREGHEEPHPGRS